MRPAHAQMIIDGLGQDGSADSMKADLLKGSREEIYWMKLPEKASEVIRRFGQHRILIHLPSQDPHICPSSSVLINEYSFSILAK